MGAKIPQDVTREDKLVGPLTLKQFLYILGTAGLVFVAYQYYSVGFLYLHEFIILSALISIFGLMLTFAQINGRPFAIFLLNLSRFATTNHRQIWIKEPRNLVAAIRIKADDIKDTRAELADRKSGKAVKMQIEHLANILDTGGTMTEGKNEVMSNNVNTFSPAAPADTEPADVEDVLANFD
jgi:hypothetical protein